MSHSSKQPILDIKNLKKYYPIEQGFLKKHVGDVKAVDDVSFTLYEGETFGLVGESGCGKTTLGRCILRAITATSGQVLFRPTENDEVDLIQLNKKNLRSIRPYIQMIFQDPYASLDPRMTVLDIVGEPLLENGIAKGKKMADRVRSLMESVGLEATHLNRYPHAFSGGQRQRIGIARALAPNPRLIVCDEPVSALDVSVQAQILNLLMDLQRDFKLTFLFISHDLAVVQHISDRIAVMYIGQIVEMADADTLFQSPKHPYTEALLASAPKPDPSLKTERIIVSGEVANPSAPPTGCHFHPRCVYAKDICKKEKPPLSFVNPDHSVACHFAEELQLQGVRV